MYGPEFLKFALIDIFKSKLKSELKECSSSRIENLAEEEILKLISIEKTKLFAQNSTHQWAAGDMSWFQGRKDKLAEDAKKALAPFERAISKKIAGKNKKMGYELRKLRAEMVQPSLEGKEEMSHCHQFFSSVSEAKLTPSQENFVAKLAKMHLETVQKSYEILSAASSVDALPFLKDVARFGTDDQIKWSREMISDLELDAHSEEVLSSLA